jgi:hypothetical protein
MFFLIFVAFVAPSRETPWAFFGQKPFSRDAATPQRKTRIEIASPCMKTMIFHVFFDLRRVRRVVA